MNSKRPGYTQTLKLRWSLLLLVALVVFVLLANARQAPSSASAPAAAGTPEEIVAEEITSQEASTDAPPLAVAIATPTDHELQLQTDSLPLLERTVTFLENIDAPLFERADDNRKTVVIQRGDTLSGILTRFNTHSALGPLLKIKNQISPLLNLKPGKPIHLEIKADKLVALVYEKTPTEHLEIALDGGKYAVTNRTLPIERQEAHAYGTIENSFYLAALKAGLSDKTIIEMVNILGWDIDFVLDVRHGDQFSVVYEEEYLNGEKLRGGDIQALEFINRGKTYRAIRYTNAAGNIDYFTPNGKSLRKPFLRNPIEYRRISSHFNPKRLHPIFKTVRPHRGVDYAAPTGTPVRSSGDGKIAFRGKKSGYGNVVIIQHGQNYSTLYAHLSKFARGQRRGSRVRQEQIIGYVGSTGYATGPHLHYEFRINDVHRNPLTVKLPDSKPLPKKQIPHFKKAITPMIAKLDTLQKAYAAIIPVKSK